MGMDVFGNEPATKAGEYFGKNCWNWRPLWDYCHDTAPELIDDNLHDAGHYNDGAGLDADDAKALADILQQRLDRGDTKQYKEDRLRLLAALDNVICFTCKGTGKRIVSKKQLDQPFGITVPPQSDADAIQIQCAICKGKGDVRDPSNHYDFSVEAVQKFVNFLYQCGGFAIC